MTARIHDTYRPAAERVLDYLPVEPMIETPSLREQAKRCMNCGIPFCCGSGCTLANVIPEFNAAVMQGRDRLAWQILSSTSAMPEFTAWLCPALCEGSCTCGIGDEPVMIRQVEKYIVETAFENGWVTPGTPNVRNGRSVAVVGSGPAGLVVADMLNRAGFTVKVYERNSQPGGLLRYGIPDFKLAKPLVERRVALMREAGVEFIVDTDVGSDVSGEYLKKHNDAVVMAVGTPLARDLPVPGRELAGIHFALEFLQGMNRAIGNELAAPPISAKGRKVLVVGGGDTGSDCIGTALRQGAESVVQIEIMPEPPATRSPSSPWPDWPYEKRTSSSHKEGRVERRWALSTLRFIGHDGHVSGAEVSAVRWECSPEGRPLKFTAEPDTAETIEADLVLLAMGFEGVPKEGAVAQLGLGLTPRRAIVADPARNVFAVGDCVLGPSLIVRAMADARQTARRLAESF